jgi:3-deoxy-D-manno-octulosonic acid (KDO) 8-phosphate synthase
MCDSVFILYYFSISNFGQILEKVKATYDLPVVTDVHESHQVIDQQILLC